MEKDQKKVIIFGIQDYAELARYYLDNDSPYAVEAFCVNRAYIPNSATFNGLPVLPFEDVETTHPPDQYLFFAPMSPKNMNQFREQVFQQIKEKGYRCVSYVSSKATLFNNEIGQNCFILENNTIQPYTNIGDNVVLWSGNHIGHHGYIGNHVTFTSHVVMSGHCHIGDYSFLGVNATLRDGLTIGKGSLIGMASSILKDTEDWGIYVGNPAKQKEGKRSYEVM